MKSTFATSLLALLLASAPALAQTPAAPPAAALNPAAVPPAPAAAPATTPAGPCGTARPDLKAIETAEGLVIAPDGTIYFTGPYGKGAHGFLGRWKPPYAGQPETKWLDLGGKALGITIDPKRAILYAGSRDRQKLLGIYLAEHPEVVEIADAEPAINGVTLGEDRAVYYTDQKGGNVYRVTFEGGKTAVTTTPIEDPNGLAFGPDGKLYVLTYGKAKLTRLTLKDGKETAREALVELPGGKNADGIAFDSTGRIWVTASGLFQVSADGKTAKKMGESYGANLDFGRGALGCSDLYAAGNGKGIMRIETDKPGADVPWHRAKEKLKETQPPPSPPPAAPAKVAGRVKLELITRESTEPVGIVAVPGEKLGRLFVVENRGPIRILRGNKFDEKPFLDLTGKVSLWTKPNSEQGLLGLAFHPQFGKNGRFYINYTDLGWQTHVTEYRVDPKDPNRADPTTAKDLLVVHQPYNNHNGGDLQFGPDGKLYVLLGDGGRAGDPHYLARNPKSLLGKMFRIDVDASAPLPEVLGQGLRNPWRYSFDRKTGDLYIADVGQNLYEYVHYLPRAKVKGPVDFGWNVVEGKHCYQAETCDKKGFHEAVIEYPHSEGCSITGGFVYRGKALPELQGHYFYSDYCTAILRSFRIKGGKAVDSWDWKTALDPESTIAQVTSFGLDQDGEMYVLSHEGPIYKLVRK
jgi:glucose/arabinose dehydrogenase